MTYEDVTLRQGGDLSAGNKIIAVIGNGCAGAEAIKALREEGYTGQIHLFTDNRWPVANPMLTTYYIAGRIGLDRLFPYGEFYCKYEVVVHENSPVTALDARQRVLSTASGHQWRYDACLIATGASPVLLPVEGSGTDRVCTLRTVDDALRVKEIMAQRPAKTLVAGASLVGMKVVDLFCQAGLNVSLADQAGQVLPLAAHRDCAAIIEKRLRQEGVNLRLGEGMNKVETTSRGTRVYFEGGQEEEVDLLVMCLGVKPNMGFIDARQVALDKGVLVDGRMRTSAPGLYAAGDVAQGINLLSGETEVIGFWNNARYQGRTAGRNMAGGKEIFPGNVPHSISHFMGMDFVSIGDATKYDRMEKRCEGNRFVQLFWRDGLLTGANLLNGHPEAGVVKSALMKGLRQGKWTFSSDMPVWQHQLIKRVLSEVKGL